MKLSEKDYYKIIDGLSEAVWDFDPWEEKVSEDTIKEWINDVYPDLEFDTEDIERILDEMDGVQEDRKENIKAEEYGALRQDIENLIEENSEHLSPEEVGGMLVKLAANYL